MRLLYDNWNDTVSDNNVVLHLGDFAFIRDLYQCDRLKGLRGQIFIVKGNHDRNSIKWFKENLNVTVLTEPMGKKIRRIVSLFYEHEGIRFVFSHKPLTARRCEGYRKSGYELDTTMFDVNIHGHMHNKVPLIWKSEDSDNVFVNISVENLNYMPITLQTVLDKVKGG